MTLILENVVVSVASDEIDKDTLKAILANLLGLESPKHKSKK